MDKRSKKIFLTVFLIGVALLFSAKLLFDFNGFWAFFGTVGETFLSLLSYVIIGFIIAFVLDSFICFLSDKVLKKWTRAPKLKRIICIVSGYVVFFGILVFIILSLIPHLADAVGKLIDNLPGYAKQTIDLYNGTLAKLPKSVSDTIKTFLTNLPETVYCIISFTKITSIATATVKVIVNALMGIVVSVYMLLEKDNALIAAHRITDALFKKSTADKIYDAGNKINKIFKQYFTGKILEAFLVMILSFIVFLIAQIPFAMLFAVMVGLLNMIPYLGPWLSAVPVCLITMMANGFWPGIVCIICIVIIQLIDNYLINPNVVGKQIGISPLLVLAGLSVGGKLFGIPGMIIGDVLAALVKVFFYDSYITHKLESKEKSTDCSE